jgi:hypothetical protein
MKNNFQRYFSRQDHGGFDEEFLREELARANDNMRKQKPINMSTVKAKFICTSVNDFGKNGKEAILNAVYSEKGENADFAAATPRGNLAIAISKGASAETFFEPEKSYYLTFEEVTA